MYLFSLKAFGLARTRSSDWVKYEMEQFYSVLETLGMLPAQYRELMAPYFQQIQGLERFYEYVGNVEGCEANRARPIPCPYFDSV